jgi:clan AA aspartic protease
MVDVEAAIDTGFSGFLTLPIQLIQTLDLAFDRSDIFMLGDDRKVEFDLYQAELIWDGEPKAVRVLATEGTPLVGMSLLEGCHLFVDVIAGGEVRVERRPSGLE